MNAHFEHLEFEHPSFAGEGELESERGARRSASARAPSVRRGGGRQAPSGASAFGAGRSAQGGRGQGRFGSGRFGPGPGPGAFGPRPPGPRRFGPRVFGPWPYYGGGWPYPVAPVEPAPVAPEPAPAPEPEPEPEPEPADAGAADAAPAEQPQGEVPPTLSSTLTRLPAGQRPAYLALGSVTAAISDPRSAAPGLYLIEFASNGQRRAYSGQSGNVRKRLQQHLLCARMLGLSLAGHQVYVAPLPALGAAQRRAIEQRIHTDMFARSGGVLTNQRRELELSLLGPQWA